MTGCLNNDASIGSYFRMAVEDSDTVNCVPANFTSGSERYFPLSENIQFTDTVVGSNGLTGTLDRIANHLRPGTRFVIGRLLMEVGPNELANWLPRILGNDPSGTTYTTAMDHELKPFDLLFQRDQGTVIYRHCVVSRALFRAAASLDSDPESQVLRMALDIVGAEEHDAEWPAEGPGIPQENRLYWLFGDCDFELQINTPPADATALPIDAFNLLIDNNLDFKSRNSLWISFMRARERVIRLQATTPYTEDVHDELYINRFDGPGTLRFRGNKNLAGAPEEPWLTEFSFPRLYQQRITPTTSGRGEIVKSLELTAYRTHNEEPISITNQLTA